MKNIGIAESALCPCGQEVQTTVHVMQSCPLHKEERESIWPTGTPNMTSPYRTLKKKV